MSDIFREVEEDVRREKLGKLWKAYGDYIIALGAIVILGIAGFEFWQRYEASQRAKASVAFMAAQRISDPKSAAEAFAVLAKSAPAGYRLLARMEQAGNLLATGQRAAAIELYKEIANEQTGGLGDVARLRAGWASADTASRTELQTLLAPLQTAPLWKPMADEILAYSDYRAHDYLKATLDFEALSTDPASPGALKVRARAMAQFLEQGGEKNFGTVPRPLPATPPTGALKKP
ncbi:MAG: tetratricopeptide repeat protein [Rhizomicrobium sp.]